ncbi:MAG TPA: hypothetical protein VLV32_07110, partial [Burkholderiales bacterium]|nr:hypothetical protein [Burkholderiales bacterium]
IESVKDTLASRNSGAGALPWINDLMEMPGFFAMPYGLASHQRVTQTKLPRCYTATRILQKNH